MPNDNVPVQPNPKTEGDTKKDLERQTTERSQPFQVPPAPAKQLTAVVTSAGVQRYLEQPGRTRQPLVFADSTPSRAAPYYPRYYDVRMDLNDVGQRTADYLASLYDGRQLALDPFNSEDVDALVKVVLGVA